MPMTYRPTRRGFMTGAAAAGTAVSLPWLGGRAAFAQGGVLTVALPNNPVTIDPINQLNHDAMVLGQTVFENLVEFDVDGNLKPQLAKALPQISADALTYSFELRDDVTFHNGQKLTAEDVKYSFHYMLDPAHKASRRSIFTRIDRVEVDSPTKLRVILKEPYAPWLYFLTKYMGIFPAGSREKHGEDHFKSSPAGVGTGPGVFEEWRPNDYVSFKRNPNWWRKGLPHWERLVVRIIPEDSVRVAYMLTGQADIISAPPPRDFSRLVKVPGVAGASRPTNGGWFLMCANNAKPPFDDVNFRKAIAHAVDRQRFAEKVYHGLLDACAIPAPPHGWWYDKQADDSLAFDMEKAKAYLAKSKYASGAEFDLLMPATPYLLDVRDAALVLQAELAKLNIKINLKMQEFNVVLQQTLKGEHQAALFVFMQPGEPTYLIMATYTEGQVLTKSSNYTHPEVDGSLKEAFAETDQAKLKPIYAKLLRRLAEDSPHIWFGFVHTANLWRSNVQNFKPSVGLTMNVHDVKVG